MPTHRPRARRAAAIPSFALYGEAAPAGAEVLHVEAIESRSRLYHWEIDAHLHRGLHQVLWLQAGPAEVTLDGVRSQCEGPAAIVVPPGVVHGFRFTPASDGYVLTVSARALVEGDSAAVGEALAALFAQPRVLHMAADSLEAQRLRGLFSGLVAEFRMPDSASAPVLLWLARGVVWRLGQIASRQPRGDAGAAGSVGAQAPPATFTRFVALVEAHFLEHWPVSRYAERLGLTPERLNRQVRAEAGRTALEFVHERLAREACRRLVYIAAPISTLAFELGFEDPAYFCRFFKRRLGVNPRQYRERAGGSA